MCDSSSRLTLPSQSVTRSSGFGLSGCVSFQTSLLPDQAASPWILSPAQTSVTLTTTQPLNHNESMLALHPVPREGHTLTITCHRLPSSRKYFPICKTVIEDLLSDVLQIGWKQIGQSACLHGASSLALHRCQGCEKLEERTHVGHLFSRSKLQSTVCDTEQSTIHKRGIH